METLRLSETLVECICVNSTLSGDDTIITLIEDVQNCSSMRHNLLELSDDTLYLAFAEAVDTYTTSPLHAAWFRCWPQFYRVFTQARLSIACRWSLNAWHFVNLVCVMNACVGIDCTLFDPQFLHMEFWDRCVLHETSPTLTHCSSHVGAVAVLSVGIFNFFS